MIRREAWLKVGPFDTQFFMYSDEVDWCRRCQDAGWEIHYLPLAQIIHHEHKSADKVAATSRVRFHRSRIRYFRKYFGIGWATLIRFFLLMDYTWLLTEETARWAIGHRREESRQHINIYWHILKSGLR
jgi:GT2 family glycosyltransferase